MYHVIILANHVISPASALLLRISAKSFASVVPIVSTVFVYVAGELVNWGQLFKARLALTL
jgi:phage tail tape-measure protein